MYKIQVVNLILKRLLGLLLFPINPIELVTKISEISLKEETWFRG